MLTYDDVVRASRVLNGIVHRTPLDHSNTFSMLADCNVYLKMECFQKTGSFKVRGAYVKLHSLSNEQKARGVVTASAGNHAQGLAYASKMLNIRCTVVMPYECITSKGISN
jgi:threonine dehydratase